MTLLDRFRTQPQRDPDTAVRLAYLAELPMTERYQIVSTDANGRPRDTQELAQFLAKEGQLLLPMLDLIEQGEQAIDEVIDVAARTLEEVFEGGTLLGRRRRQTGSDDHDPTGASAKSVHQSSASASYGIRPSLERTTPRAPGYDVNTDSCDVDDEAPSHRTRYWVRWSA